MKYLTLAYGGVVYAAFFAAFLYLIGFVGGGMIPLITLPKTIDVGVSSVPVEYGALVNIALLLLFGVQHSVMARRSFKEQWTKIVPKAAERSTYVLTTTAVIVALFVWWTPIPAVVWEVRDPFWSGALTVAFFLGFGLVLLSTFLIDHFELFGLAQVWRAYRGVEAPAPKFHTPLFYKNVRHPLYLGFLIAFWATPMMTAGHLLFAAVWSAYIFVAIGYEERDLIRHFGDEYRAYMAKVPSIIPFGKGRE